MALIIRSIRSDDLPEVLAIQETSFLISTAGWLLRRLLAQEMAITLVAEESPGGRVLGFLVFWLRYGELRIINIATHPDFRKRGVAQALMSAALDRARLDNCTVVSLEVRSDNETAVRFYTSLEFQDRGVLYGYYAEEEADAVVMTLDPLTTHQFELNIRW